MSPAEIERLRRQHNVWRRHTAGVWTAAGFGTGQTIVDLGCGPGFTSVELASRVGPSGRVIAVDASSTALAHLRTTAGELKLSNLEIVEAAVDAVDLSRWRPHGVFARWLFSFLPDPASVIRRLADGLAPGSTLVIMDYWNYLAIHVEPAAPIFTRVFRAVHESFAAAGGSLDVAGALPVLFSEHGFELTGVEPHIQIGRPGSAVWRWLDEFQTLYLPTLVEKCFLTCGELDEYGRWWAEVSSNPGALFFTPPIVSVTGVKT